MNIAQASDLVALLNNSDYRALTFKAALLPLVGEPPFFIAPPTFAEHKAPINQRGEDKGEARHKFIGRQGDDGRFPMVELESAEQFAKRLQRGIANHLPPLKIMVGGEPKPIDLLDLPHGSTDGFLRESTLDGVPFRDTKYGKSLFSLDKKEQMQARYQHFPHRLLTGECDMQSGYTQDRMVRFGGCMWAQAIGMDALPLAAPRMGHMPLSLAKENKKYSLPAVGMPLRENAKGKALDSYGLVNAGNKDKKINGMAYHGAMVSSAYVQGSLDFAGLRQLDLSLEQQAALVALWLIGVRENIRNYLPRKNAGLRAKSIAWNIVPSFGDDIPLESPPHIGEHLLEGAPAWRKERLELIATDLVVKHREWAAKKALGGEDE